MNDVPQQEAAVETTAPTTDATRPVYWVEKYFKFEHLPENLKAVSQPFAELAQTMAVALPQNEETCFALRKLLEAKDCAVRAILT